MNTCHSPSCTRHVFLSVHLFEQKMHAHLIFKHNMQYKIENEKPVLQPLRKIYCLQLRRHFWRHSMEFRLNIQDSRRCNERPLNFWLKRTAPPQHVPRPRCDAIQTWTIAACTRCTRVFEEQSGTGIETILVWCECAVCLRVYKSHDREWAAPLRTSQSHGSMWAWLEVKSGVSVVAERNLIYSGPVTYWMKITYIRTSSSSLNPRNPRVSNIVQKMLDVRSFPDPRNFSGGFFLEREEAA